MATLTIIRTRFNDLPRDQGKAPAMSDKFISVETVTGTGVSVVAASVIEGDECWYLVAQGGPLSVAFGVEPAAAPGACLPLQDGIPVTLQGTAGFGIAVLDEALINP